MRKKNRVGWAFFVTPCAFLWPGIVETSGKQPGATALRWEADPQPVKFCVGAGAKVN